MAHDMMIKHKYDDWGFFGWIHNKLGYSMEVTDLAVGEFAERGLPGFIYSVFTRTTTTYWRTVEGGMSRLPEAFKVLIENKLRLRVKVSKLSTTKEGRVSVQWKHKPTDVEYEHKDYDYVIVNAPLTISLRYPEAQTFSKSVQSQTQASRGP
ncbi:hypothetical protein BC937DRAFT_87869 [Endogone sp. FLAS-F59071]|nr:hypothetical protein BC937DRAFT_87869 [Endogone sp. FLAS-F59071]|eukprot:RUS12446.1 hypothetical protein BC937DRAFT_87869 [Endogone sp. FLAS-F59071]